MMRLALNPDTTPLSISDELVFKPLQERAREAVEAGFTAVNVDFSSEKLSAGQVLELLGSYHLKVASAFFQGDFHDPTQEAKILLRAREQAAFSRSIGQDCLFVSSTVSPPERFAIAGRVREGESPGLSAPEFQQMARVLEKIALEWKTSGIQLCYHPHVATYVETPREIARLMDSTDPGLVRLGADTGHIYYGGGDPLPIIEQYLGRLSALHIKDVDAGAVALARRQKLDYRRACRAGIWTEIGTGVVDFPALFRLLRKQDWSGWVIVETDHTRLATALASSRLSREYLRREIGL